MATMELMIHCSLIEDAFAADNGLSEPIKIVGAEYDEWEDLLVLTVNIDESDINRVPVGSTCLEKCIADELAEDAA